MDPRHPELAVARIKELIKQYDRIEDDIRHATVSSKLGQLEREGGLVVQEICLVAPRIHEAMIQASRQRRHELSRGIAFGYTPEEKVGEYTKATIGIEEPEVVGDMVKNEAPVETVKENLIVEKEKAEASAEVVEEPEEELTFEQQAIKYTLELDKEIEEKEKQEATSKAKKKTTRKKKTAKKADK